MPTEVEIAWAAGLFEGEGCLWEMKTAALSFSYLGLAVEMTDEEIVNRFHSFLKDAGFAGKTKVTTRWRGNEKHARQWTARLSGSKAEGAFQLMRPYLGTRRRARGDEIIAKRKAQLEAATTTRACKGCGVEFTVHPESALKVWCTHDCYHRAMSKTPRGMELARARNRRYKDRLRRANSSQSTSLF